MPISKSSAGKPDAEQGAMRPPYPRTRGIAPGPNLRWRRYYQQMFFRMLIGETEREPTGAMKTKKRAVERMHSLTASFLSFSPDAQHPVGGVSHRPARGRLCRSQLAKIQSSSANVCLRDALFHREMVWMIHIDISGIGCRVNDPAGGWGETPQVSPTQHRKIVCII